MKNDITSLLLVSIFKNIKSDKVVSSFINFLSDLENNSNFEIVIKSYTDFIQNLYETEKNQNLYSYIKYLIYTDENIISNGCSDCIRENNQILSTASYELSLFDDLLKSNYNLIKDKLYDEFPDKRDIISHLPMFYVDGRKNFDLCDVIESYKTKGYGIFSCYSAFVFNENSEIKPIKRYETLSFADLKNYDYQKDIIKSNTKAFLDGKEANNILLYGDRGCGKSSTVKALINEYSDYNLKIIQVYKESFAHLAKLYDAIRNLPLKFIIFADDISFEEDDKNFSSIKAVLEGALSNRPSNSVIYATTNRMHLVKESFSSREGNEVHYNDTIDEMVSLSDRFGIMLTFSYLTKNEYLDIVGKIADDCCVEKNDMLYRKAEEFAALKAIRTPRVARQFITSYLAEL